LVALVEAMVVRLIASLLGTLAWKISIHTAVVAGAVVILVLVAGPLLLVLAPLALTGLVFVATWQCRVDSIAQSYLDEDDRLGRAHRLTHIDLLQTRVLRLERQQLLDDHRRRSAQSRAGLDGLTERRQPRLPARRGSAVAAICSSLSPRPKPSGANIFRFSSNSGVASRIACSSLSAQAHIVWRRGGAFAILLRPCPVGCTARSIRQQ
jgi:hypothetical protein